MTAPAAGEDALLGTDVGRFRLVRLLGKGENVCARDCRETSACKRFGRCTAEACATSQACAEAGTCVLDGDRGVTSDESCRASTVACRERNRCRAAPNRADCVR